MLDSANTQERLEMIAKAEGVEFEDGVSARLYSLANRLLFTRLHLYCPSSGTLHAHLNFRW